MHTRKAKLLSQNLHSGASLDELIEGLKINRELNADLVRPIRKGKRGVSVTVPFSGLAEYVEALDTPAHDDNLYSIKFKQEHIALVTNHLGMEKDIFDKAIKWLSDLIIYFDQHEVETAVGVAESMQCVIRNNNIMTFHNFVILTQIYKRVLYHTTGIAHSLRRCPLHIGNDLKSECSCQRIKASEALLHFAEIMGRSEMFSGINRVNATGLFEYIITMLGSMIYYSEPDMEQHVHHALDSTEIGVAVRPISRLIQQYAVTLGYDCHFRAKKYSKGNGKRLMLEIRHSSNLPLTSDQLHELVVTVQLSAGALLWKYGISGFILQPETDDVVIQTPISCLHGAPRLELSQIYSTVSSASNKMEHSFEIRLWASDESKAEDLNNILASLRANLLQELMIFTLKEKGITVSTTETGDLRSRLTFDKQSGEGDTNDVVIRMHTIIQSCINSEGGAGYITALKAACMKTLLGYYQNTSRKLNIMGSDFYLQTVVRVLDVLKREGRNEDEVILRNYYLNTIKLRSLERMNADAYNEASGKRMEDCRVKRVNEEQVECVL